MQILWFGHGNIHGVNTQGKIPALNAAGTGHGALKAGSLHRRYDNSLYPGLPAALHYLVKISSKEGIVQMTMRIYEEIIHGLDRKSTRLNSSHVAISYAVFCLKKKKLTMGIFAVDG